MSSALKKTAIVITNGCPENRIDCAETEQCLVYHGWELTQNANLADLVVLNLCGLLNEIEEKSLLLIKHLKNIKKKDARIIVTGCLPKINNPAVKDVTLDEIIIVEGHDIEGMLKALNENNSQQKYSSNYLIPLSRVHEPLKNKIQRKINNSLSIYAILNRLYFKEYHNYWARFDIVQPDTFYIKICSGCLNGCSYCAVKLSRGSVKSEPIDEIEQEFSRGLKAGYTLFSLIGSDLGSYGKDIQTDLPSLLKQLVSIEGDFKISLRNVHPQLLIDQLHEMTHIVKSEKISHITTAIQHGNDKILKLMNRHYTIKNCINAINTLKSYSNKLEIRTQIIVGFPGETNKEFADTLRLIESVNVDFFEVYPFSPRTGTIAAKLEDQNTVNTIQKRNFVATRHVLNILKKKHAKLDA